MKEAQAINKSLSALGDVISSLASKVTRPPPSPSLASRYARHFQPNNAQNRSAPH